MRCILFILTGSIYFQSASGNPILSYFQNDTVMVRKIILHKKIKSSNLPHKGKPIVHGENNANIHSKKDMVHSHKSIGIDHPVPNQKKLDSIIRVKNKEKIQGK